MPKMSTEAKLKLNEFNDKQNDWYSGCPKCGLRLRGTLKELKEHKCAETEE